MYEQLFRVTLFAVALIASTVTHGAGLIIFERGVGGITATAKFDRKYIAPLVPGYALRAGQRATKGESYRVLEIMDGREVIATISPGNAEKKYSAYV